MNAQEILPANLDVRVIERSGVTSVLVKPLALSMGLDWAGEYLKLVANPTRWAVRIAAANPGRGGAADSMACIPLRLLPGWLMEVDPSQVRPEITAWLIGFQAGRRTAQHACPSRRCARRRSPALSRAALPGATTAGGTGTVH